MRITQWIRGYPSFSKYYVGIALCLICGRILLEVLIALLGYSLPLWSLSWDLRSFLFVYPTVTIILFLGAGVLPEGRGRRALPSLSLLVPILWGLYFGTRSKDEIPIDLFIGPPLSLFAVVLGLFRWREKHKEIIVSQSLEDLLGLSIVCGLLSLWNAPTGMAGAICSWSAYGLCRQQDADEQIGVINTIRGLIVINLGGVVLAVIGARLSNYLFEQINGML